MQTDSHPPESSGRRFSTFELVFLASLAALIVLANFTLRFPIKVPGRSGLIWMALLVTLRSVVPKRGSATIVGLLSGFVAAFVGLGDKGALDTVLSYTGAGLGVDFVFGLTRKTEALWVCLLAGAAGNLAKLGVKVLLEIWIGIPTGFVLLGRLYPALTHLLFGLIGGYLGFLLLVALRRAGFFAYLGAKR